jgi:MFS family permease
VTPWLLVRFGPKILVVSGLALITAGLLAFAPVPTDANFATNILPTIILTGVGFGLLFMPSVSVAMSDVAPQEAGLASGLANVAIQIGAAIGVAALATISTSVTARLLSEHQPVTVAVAGGYRVSLLVAAACTTASLLAAILLLQPRRQVVPAFDPPG